MKVSRVEMLEDGGMVEVGWSDGDVARFHAVWLRDNGLDATTRSPVNGQWLISLLDIPAGIRVARAEATPQGDMALVFAPGGHESLYPADWLRNHRYDRHRDPVRGWTSRAHTLWDRSLADRIPAAAWPSIAAARTALGRWLGAVRRYGFAVLTDVPRRSGSLIDVARRFGFVRETNYGPWFEVKAEVNPSNLAYTNLGLQAHTDNPYRDPVPTLQLLACLDSVDGGESLVVDGFAVADRLRRDDSAAFELLADHPARFDYAGQSGVRLSAKRPILELGPDGELLAVRFNNRSAAPFVDIPFATMPAFYAAYRRFAELLEEPSMAVTFRLAPGELFIVDNTRVLHARRAFSGTGSRWLQGCYADKDGLLSTLASIEHEQQEAAE